MKLFIVCIRDRAIDGFSNPFFVPAIGAGVRSFKDEVNRAESPMYSHADDYDLYHLGEFETDSGLFTTDNPRMIAVGKDMKIPVS